MADMLNALDSTSTRPYLIRALYEWCADNGLTPYVAVTVDGSVKVPKEFVKNGEIVLNISYDATSDLRLGNDFIEFKARFGGVPRDILVPIDRVMAIYARENGQGMAFPMISSESDEAQKPTSIGSAKGDSTKARPTLTVAHSATKAPEDAHEDPPPDSPTTPPATSGGAARPALKRIK